MDMDVKHGQGGWESSMDMLHGDMDMDIKYEHAALAWR
jgi:hypothetical protein